VAILTLIAGSPVVQVTWFTILLGALAPMVWPMSSSRAEARSVQVPSESDPDALVA
jgi:hypothetical protein